MNPYSYNCFNIDVSSGLDKHELIIDGKVFEYIKGNVTIYVQIDSTAAPLVAIEPKNGFRFPYKKLYVTCEACDQQISLLCLKKDDFQFLRNDIDIGQDRSNITDSMINKNCFIAGAECYAGATFYPHVQLWNPSSTKLVVLDRVEYESDYTTYGFFIKYTSALSTPHTALFCKYLGFLI